MVLYRFLNNNRAPFMPPYPEAIRYADRERESAIAKKDVLTKLYNKKGGFVSKDDNQAADSLDHGNGKEIKRRDGTVVVKGDNKYGQCDVDVWEDIEEVRSGSCNRL